MLKSVRCASLCLAELPAQSRCSASCCAVFWGLCSSLDAQLAVVQYSGDSVQVFD